MSRGGNHDQDCDPPALVTEEPVITARDMLEPAGASLASDTAGSASTASTKGTVASGSSSSRQIEEPGDDDADLVEEEEEEEEEELEEAEDEAEEEDGRAHPFSRKHSHPKPDEDDGQGGQRASDSSRHRHFSVGLLLHSHRATPPEQGVLAEGSKSTPKKVATGRHGLPMTRTISFREGETPRRRRHADTLEGEEEEEEEEDGLSVAGGGGDGWARSPTGHRRSFGIPLSTTWSRASTATDGTAESYVPRFAPRNRVMQGLRDHGAAKRRRRLARAGAQAEEEEEEAEEADIVPHDKVRGMPLFSGLLAPFSIMLEVPGLTSRWYLRVGGGFYRNNPAILDVGLAISMASAVVANIAIIARFTGKASPRKSTLFAIGCFILHDLINVIALSIFGVIHAVDDGFTYSEAFWMTAGATFASVLCTTTLMIDFIGTRDFQHSGSGLTPKQTRLVIVVMGFLVFLSLGSMIYALLLPLVFLDAVYYFMTTIATVGLGDITPKTVAERVLLFFLAPVGIILLAILVATTRETIMEEFEAQYRRRRERFKRKQQERLAARQLNRKAIKDIKRGYGRGRSAGTGLPPASLLFPVLSPTHPFGGVSKEQKGGKSKTSQPQQFEQLMSLTSMEALKQRWKVGFARQPVRSAPADDPEAGAGDAGAAGSDGSRSAKSSETAADSSSVSGDKVEKPGEAEAEPISPEAHIAKEMAEMEAQLLSQRERIDEEWREFKKKLDSSEKRDFWVKLILTFTLFFAFWMVGASVFHATEGWTYFESLYFTFAVLSTIGYGDFVPKTPAGRAFFIVWALLGVAVMSVTLAVLGDAWGNALKRGATGASFESLVQKRKIKAAMRDHTDTGSKKPLAAFRRRLKSLKAGVTGRELNETSTAQTEASSSLALGRITSRLGQDSPTVAPAILETMTPVLQTVLPTDAEMMPLPPSASILRSPDTEATLTESPRSPETTLTFAAPEKGKSANAFQPAERQPNSQAPQAEEEEIPIHDMPLALARSAMSVHQHILAYNKIQRRLVLDTIRTVPELAHLLLSEMAEHQPHAATSHGGGADGRSAPHRGATLANITPQHKDKLLSAAKAFHDPAAEAAVAGWIEMRQFEDELHGLIAKTGSLREELLERQHRLDVSRTRIEELERQLEHAVGAGHDEESEDGEDDDSDDEDENEDGDGDENDVQNGAAEGDKAEAPRIQEA